MKRKETKPDSTWDAADAVVAPALIVFAGPPCSGKSPVAEKLAVRNDYVYLQVDRIRVELFPDSDQRKEHREAAYKEMHKRAEGCLRAGQGVIVDATYQPFNQREDLQRVVERANVLVYVVECIVTPQEAVRRFRARSGSHPAVDLTSSRVEELARKFPFSEIGLQLDTTHSMLGCVSEVEAYIRQDRPVNFSLWAKPPVDYVQPSPVPEKKAPGTREDSRSAKTPVGLGPEASPPVKKAAGSEAGVRLTDFSKRKARTSAIRTGVFLSSALAFVIVGTGPTIVFAFSKWPFSREVFSYFFHASLALNHSQSAVFVVFLVFPIMRLARSCEKGTPRIVTAYLMNWEAFSMLLICLTTAWLLRSSGRSSVAQYLFPVLVLSIILYVFSRLALVPRRGLKLLSVSKKWYQVCFLLTCALVAVVIDVASGGVNNVWGSAHLFLTKPGLWIALWVASLALALISYGVSSFAGKSVGPVRASRDWPWVIVFATSGIILSLQIIADHWPQGIQSITAYVASRPLSGLSDWGLFWLGLAGLSAAVEPIVHVIEPMWNRAFAILDAGRISRYMPFEDTRPSDLELYDAYFNRTLEAERDGFLLFGIPLYFVVKPRGDTRFDVLMRRIEGRAPKSELMSRAGQCGLDWVGFSAWRKAVKAKDYWDWIQEYCIGCARIDPSELRNGQLSIDIAKVPWVDYVSRELSANLKSRLLPPDMRWIFEGDRWVSGEVDLSDLQYAAQYYSMIVSTASVVTTRDNYIVLQRRSKHISEGAGGIATTASGFSHWGKDTALLGRLGPRKSLIDAALRELEEETGILPVDLDLPATAPHFMGAAFNLLHGRDLNFYAHFQCKRTSEEVARLRPLARDRWESAHYIFVPVEAVKEDGTLSPPHTKILFGATRHLRGALFCFAKWRYQANAL